MIFDHSFHVMLKHREYFFKEVILPNDFQKYSLIGFLKLPIYETVLQMTIFFFFCAVNFKIIKYT
jgi:hypothetical protein